MLITDLVYWWLLPLLVWDIIWKGIALWKCGKNDNLVWFIFILILNTAGILPIIYLLFFQKKGKNKVTKKEEIKEKPVKPVKRKSSKRR